MTASQQTGSRTDGVRYLRMNRSVRDAVRVLSDPEVDAVIVVDGDREDCDGAFIGILTEREIFRAMAEQGLDVLDRLVWMLTTNDFVSVDVRTTPADRLQAFCAHKTNHIAIMDGLCLHSVQSIWDCVAEDPGRTGAPEDWRSRGLRA
ncbi:CBS domain-containing protein [Methylobacterium sp. J-068]|uniref:CBS domain-containing protein n=1 Tax=Methylobacterium sp. J-068 TaxID=2836649 RepID=UPI001FBA2A93|nr:CBS domain-containing protein [Methylobacterium sp. J-068]MCJ2033997.1 CBS domain-containing protein [Methylobacterium sp. J-068]